MVGKFMQRCQGGFALFLQGVAVGDEDHIFLGEIGFFLTFFNLIFFYYRRNPLQGKRCGFLPVYFLEQVFYLIHAASPFINIGAAANCVQSYNA